MTPARTCGPREWMLATVAVMAGCTHTVKVDPIKLEPIDITLHVYIEADKKLDSFFEDVDKPASPPATPVRPAASPVSTEGGSP